MSKNLIPNISDFKVNDNTNEQNKILHWWFYFQDDYYETSPRHQSTLKPGGSHSCDECFKTFSSPGKLKQHEYTHTGETPFECKIPGKTILN